MGALGNPLHERFCQELHKLLWAGGKLGESRTQAYELAGFEGGTSAEHNARKLANKAPIKARMAELADFAAKLAGLDAGWLLVESKRDHDELGEFNYGDYLGEPDDTGARAVDLTHVSREKMALINGVSTRVRIDYDGEKTITTSISGPDKYHVRNQIRATMARIGGFEAPKKIAPTTPDGKESAFKSLEDLIRASYGSETKPNASAEGTAGAAVMASSDVSSPAL